MATTEELDFRATLAATRLAGRFSERLGGAFAARLWFTPWKVPLGERALAKQEGWLAATAPVTYRVNGRAVAGFVAGEGPTVLLVHGWGERGAALGAFVTPLVDAGFRVVGVDLPGHGRTSSGRIDIFTISATLRGLADRLGGIDAVIGHSMGGYNAAVAISEGLNVRAAVLLAPASDVGHMMAKFEAAFGLPARATSGLRAHIERRFGDDVWERLDVRSHATGFEVPALIVHDREDPQIDASESEALAAAWPSARTLLTNGLGHDKGTRDPEVIAAVSRFLVENLQPARDRELIDA